MEGEPRDNLEEHSDRKPRDFNAKAQREENRSDPKTLKGALTGTPKATCGKTMRMTAVWETRKRHMPVPGAWELLPKEEKVTSEE